jgi:hypothetical protein
VVEWVVQHSDTDTPEVAVNIAFHNGFSGIFGVPQGILDKKKWY